MKRQAWLWIELLCVYIAVPLLMYERILPNWPIPFLLLVLVWALVVLRHDTAFDQKLLMQRAGVGAGPRTVLPRDIPLLLLLGLAVWLAAPKLLFSLIKNAPGIWLLVMILYPVFSVYPQELLYRAYFFHRYKPLFGNGAGMIAASAILFGFVHIIFGSWISIALTVIGGVLFGLTYRKSGSLLLTCLEHALFGDFIFTIGIGHYFYHLARH
jgi:membrane protease YdiL (CAAX protease family)